MSRVRVNVVVRTFNEEDWIKHCLKEILNQTFSDFVITVVDSGSLDATVNVVQWVADRNPGKVKILHLDKFFPGDAINRGVHAVDSEYFICISAHCIPHNADWIATLVQLMDETPGAAGAYGRQTPLGCTHPDDVRDLFLTFGPEARLNQHDPFFHNANSIVRRSVWLDTPFDEKTPHIEDRIWARQVLDLGWSIGYLPTAEVYHYHGMHQHGKHRSFRAQTVSEVLQELDGTQELVSAFDLVADSLLVPTLILVPQFIANMAEVTDKIRTLSSTTSSFGPTFAISHLSAESEDSLEYTVISRSDVDDGTTNLRDLLRNALLHIENRRLEPVDGLIIYDLNYKNLNYDFGPQCARLMFDRWTSSVLPAWKDHGNYWVEDESGYSNISSSYASRKSKKAVYRTILGQGAAIRASVVRSSQETLEAGELVWSESAALLERHFCD